MLAASAPSTANLSMRPTMPFARQVVLVQTIHSRACCNYDSSWPGGVLIFFSQRSLELKNFMVSKHLLPL